MTSSQTPDAGKTETDGYYVRAAAGLILAFLALRLALAAQLPLIADEAYAVVVSRFPALSYFDHPPLGFGLARAAAWLAGNEAGFVVRLPHVLIASLSAWLLFLVARRAFGGQAGFWALAWYSVAPFFLVSAGLFVVPDGPLNFFLLLALWLVLPDLLEYRKLQTRRWLLAGLALGLALLSKYTAALFGAGAGILLLSSARGRKILTTAAPWLAIAIAFMCLTPVLVWNIQNGWASFAFQSGRAVGGDFNLLNFIYVQLGQAGFLLPWIWVAAVFTVIAGLVRPGRPAERVFAILAAVPIVLFDVVAMFGREILPHWPMPGFLFAFPLLGLWSARLARSRPNLLRGGFVVSVALVAALGAATIVQIRGAAITNALGLDEQSDFGWTFLDWNALNDNFAERGILTGPQTFIVPASWIVGAKAGHALGPRIPIAEPLRDARHFAYQYDMRLDGRTDGYALLAAWPGEAGRAAEELRRLVGDRYALAGDHWLIDQRRSGYPGFVIVVQPVTTR